MRISSNFDGGNIKCLECSDPSNIRLEIKKDNQSDFYQWFYFRLTGAKDRRCRIHLTNAKNAAYTDGWENYQAVASYDRAHWYRVETEYDGESLIIHHQPELNSIYFAYFAPYSMERHADLISDAQLSPLVELEVLGSTLDNQDMDLLCIGEPSKEKKVCWFIARQHPGETMAEWWMEGFLEKLLDENDPISRELLKKAVFYVVPNMNPDGSRRGNLRTNAAGANLNREWRDATMEHSPEVFLVRQKMEETGVDFCLDVHGDEALPYNFIAGSEGIPSWSKRYENWLNRYKTAFMQASPDFQTKHGYPESASGKANMTMSTNYIAETFSCLAMTLEMPFKDTVDTPNEFQGWSPERTRVLAEANLTALYTAFDELF